jgi:hypothetical protein
MIKKLVKPEVVEDLASQEEKVVPFAESCNCDNNRYFAEDEIEDITF